MTDKLTEAIERADKIVCHRLYPAPSCDGTDKGLPCFKRHAAIRSLAEIVREYGHGPHCACHDGGEGPRTAECQQATDESYGGHAHPYRDPSCLPPREEAS